MEELNRAIVKTINYGKRYKNKLTLKQLKIRLLSNKVFSGFEIEKAAKKYNLKKEKKETSSQINEVIRLVNKLAPDFGDILLIGLTGSVAAENQKKNDDIDLMVITKQNRLWLTRLRWWSWLKKRSIPQRKYGVTGKKDDICANLWLEEGTLSLPMEKRTLKNAVDMMMMKPLISRGNIYQRFLEQNKWVKKYVANGYQRRINENIFKSKRKKVKNKNMWKDLINNICFWGQYFYMKKKIRGEIVNKKRAFFHRK